MWFHRFFTETSNAEIPTIIHLAAKYGYKNLMAILMELNCFWKAYSVTNKEHNHPEVIAENREHTSLAKFLRDASELVSFGQLLLTGNQFMRISLLNKEWHIPGRYW